METEKSELDKFLALLFTLEEVFAYALKDAREAKEYEGVFYNVDFSILYPYLFPEATAAIPEFLPSGREIFSLLRRAADVDLSFELAFTGASFLELIDAINHQRQFWHMARGMQERPTLEELQKKIDKPDVTFEQARTILINNDYALKELELALSERGLDRHVTTPLKKAADLFRPGGLLHGIGSSLLPQSKSFWTEYGENYENVLSDMLRRRRDRQARPPNDRKFHYSVDSANAALSNTCNRNSKRRLYFATPDTYTRLRALRSTGTKDNFGRHPLVPAYRISGEVLRRENYFRDTERYLSQGIRLVEYLKTSLEHVNDLGEATSMERRGVRDLMDDYMEPLKNTKPGSDDKSPISSKEGLVAAIEIARKGRALRELAGEAEKRLIRDSRELFTLASQALGDDIVLASALADDEVVKQLRREFEF